MMKVRKEILSALIGLVGAVGNNGKTEHTDGVVCMALLSDHPEEAVRAVQKEKFQIAPDCAVCQSPCGNTSDYDISKFDEWSGEVKNLKEEIAEKLVEMALRGKESGELPLIAYKAIAFLGYELEIESYQSLLKDM